MTMRFASVIALLLLFALAVPAWAQKHAEHVFIISFDGGKPAVMQNSKMPELMSMVQKGAVTWHAQTVFPSITLTSHTSMLTGVVPEKHQVYWNEWEPQRSVIETPTIFRIAKSQNLSTAMFVGKPKFIHLFQAQSLDNFRCRRACPLTRPGLQRST